MALPGASRHGAEFAAAAAAAGAVAVLTDRGGAERLATPGMQLPVVERDDPRRQLGALAAAVYGYPSVGRLMFGITGTNGKTTTSFLLEAALRSAGLRTGVVGTLGFSLDGTALTGARTTITTPEAPELQAVLAVLAERGAEAIVMEVSSHALALGRADAIAFDVVAFTNFGRDHLDFHGDRTDLLRGQGPTVHPGTGPSGGAERGRSARARTRGAGASHGSARGDRRQPQLRGRRSTRSRRAGWPLTAGSSCAPAPPNGRSPSVSRCPATFNVRNALTALAMADQAGVDLDRAAAGSGRGRGAGSDAAGGVGAARPRGVRRLRAHAAGGGGRAGRARRPAPGGGAGLRWGPGSRQAGTHGRGRRGRCRGGRGHRRQPALRGSGRDPGPGLGAGRTPSSTGNAVWGGRWPSSTAAIGVPPSNSD